MSARASLCEQIVFRWDPENAAGNGGYGPVAYSCDREWAEWVYEQTRTLLRPTESQQRSSIGLLSLPDGRAMLFKRRAARDVSGRPNSMCHAVVGDAAVLKPGLGPALRHWRWANRVPGLLDSGRVLPRVDGGVLREEAEIEVSALHRELGRAPDEFATLAAMALRRPRGRLLVLDEEQRLPVDALLFGLTVLFAPYAASGWSYSTFETADTAAYRIAFVPLWPTAAFQASDATRIDLHKPVDADRAFGVGVRLAGLYLDDDRRAKTVLEEASRRARAEGRGPEPDAESLAHCLNQADRKARTISSVKDTGHPRSSGPGHERHDGAREGQHDRQEMVRRRDHAGPGSAGGHAAERRVRRKPYPAEEYLHQYYDQDEYTDRGDDAASQGGSTAVVRLAGQDAESTWKPPARWDRPRRARPWELVRHRLRRLQPSSRIAPETGALPGDGHPGPSKLTGEKLKAYVAALDDESLLALVDAAYPTWVVDVVLERIWSERALRSARSRDRLADLACGRIARPIERVRTEEDLARDLALFDIAVRPALRSPGTWDCVGEMVDRLWQDRARGRDLVMRIVRRSVPVPLPATAWRTLVVAMAEEFRVAEPPRQLPPSPHSHLAPADASIGGPAAHSALPELRKDSPADAWSSRQPSNAPRFAPDQKMIAVIFAVAVVAVVVLIVH